MGGRTEICSASPYLLSFPASHRPQMGGGQACQDAGSNRGFGYSGLEVREGMIKTNNNREKW